VARLCRRFRLPRCRSVRGVNEGDQRADSRAERRAARELIGRYHEEQLGLLLEHLREGFVRLDAGQIDAFELDELIHRYKRSARELWKFCGQSSSGRLTAARTVRYLEAQVQDLPDWWGCRRATPPTLSRTVSYAGSAFRGRAFVARAAGTEARPRRSARPAARAGR
jgi:hypothetical protein